jgi:hypothetical protein
LPARFAIPKPANLKKTLSRNGLAGSTTEFSYDCTFAHFGEHLECKLSTGRTDPILGENFRAILSRKLHAALSVKSGGPGFCYVMAYFFVVM